MFVNDSIQEKDIGGRDLRFRIFFGAPVEWKVIKALARTEAVDLWILFPYAAINRMLVSDTMPPKAWAKRLTRIFGTEEWQKKFYSTRSWRSLPASLNLAGVKIRLTTEGATIRYTDPHTQEPITHTHPRSTRSTRSTLSDRRIDQAKNRTPTHLLLSSPAQNS